MHSQMKFYRVNAEFNVSLWVELQRFQSTAVHTDEGRTAENMSMIPDG